jgi:hypothetical protein
MADQQDRFTTINQYQIKSIVQAYSTKFMLKLNCPQKTVTSRRGGRRPPSALAPDP